jgi:hypothetical protein
MIKKAIFPIFIWASITIAHAQSNPVIIELFTSQGCSSCPAADRNLTEIIEHYKKENKEVYGLSFHVDYWNYIGWKDPYSNKEYTSRQRNYAQLLNLSSIYTPQMIVNGKVEFVGSNKQLASKLIEEATTHKAYYQITINKLLIKGNLITIRYSLDKATTDEQLNIAIVEKELENFVPRGENSGKKLHHDNVVRVFKSVVVSREGEIEIEAPSNLNFQKASAILYIQRKNSEIIGSAIANF